MVIHRCWLLLLLVATMGAPSLAKQDRRLAILVVARSSGTEDPVAQEVVSRLSELLTEVGYVGRVPLRYHFDKPAERDYCVKVLKIQEKDLVFIGVVGIDGRGAVLEVVQRLPNAQRNIEVAAQEAIHRWRVLSGLVQQ